MNKPRPPKKTETLEVRLPHAVKRDFMARTRSRGRTASAVLREFIDAYLADDLPAKDRPMFKRIAKPAAASARPNRAVGRESVVANIKTAPRR